MPFVKSASQIALFFIVVSVCTFTRSFGQDAEIRQKAVDLKSSLSILTISLQPGDEDFQLLNELRFGKGANVTSAYLTNGESGEDDHGSNYPNMLAAIRREEATSAVEYLGCNALFFNIASPGSMEDSTALWRIWNKDSLQVRLMRAISSVRPHLVILFPERFVQEASVPWLALRENLRVSILRLQQPKSMQELQRMAGFPAWEVQRAVVGRKIKGEGTRTLTEEALASQSRYSSLSQQLRLIPLSAIDYSDVLYPSAPGKFKNAYDGLPVSPSPSLRPLRRKINDLCVNIEKTRNLRGRKRAYAKQAGVLADSVDYLIGTKYASFRGPDQKFLLLWKEGLQNLRNDLLGASVSFTLQDSILTFRQITTLTIDSVHGISPSGRRWFFFPPTRQGWIINESMNNRFPLDEISSFRIISPDPVPLHLPSQYDGLERESIYSPLDCFVIQADSNRENSFGIRLRLRFRFAPKFSTEVLTPLVRAMEGERVVVRLTNHSHDGVADTISVVDSTVTSTRASFRLSAKESTETDTLILSWKTALDDGTFLLPIDIDGFEVANFAARAFKAAVDERKSVGLIASGGMSAAAETLRRLGVRNDRRDAASVTREWLSSHDVILLDHRVYSLDPSVGALKNLLLEKAQTGGKIIVLSQDAVSWNANALIDGVRLQASTRLGPEMSVQVAEGELMAAANELSPDDWNGWLFARAVNIVTVSPSVDVQLSLGAANVPGIISQRVGSGRVIYVNLNLPAQWLNIHPGAFRLLANLLSY